MLVNVKKEDFYYSEDEIKQLALNFGLNAVYEKMALKQDAYMLYIQNEHFYVGLTDRLVMSFIRHSRNKSIYLALHVFPNFFSYDATRPYVQLCTKEIANEDCYEGQVIPKWTVARTDPFLKKIFDNQKQVLRKSEVNRILGEFTRNVKLHLQKEKIAQIKEAADQLQRVAYVGISDDFVKKV